MLSLNAIYMMFVEAKISNPLKSEVHSSKWSRYILRQVKLNKLKGCLPNHYKSNKYPNWYKGSSDKQYILQKVLIENS